MAPLKYEVTMIVDVRDVAVLVSRGYTSVQIAAYLQISPRWVRKLISRHGIRQPTARDNSLTRFMAISHSMTDEEMYQRIKDAMAHPPVL